MFSPNGTSISASAAPHRGAIVASEFGVNAVYIKRQFRLHTVRVPEFAFKNERTIKTRLKRRVTDGSRIHFFFFFQGKEVDNKRFRTELQSSPLSSSTFDLTTSCYTILLGRMHGDLSMDPAIK